ncbi:hypothetical protein OAD57_08410 [Porticoccaceae bacterium]|nr:hypothetical protein [Porticoccaceae bacterium]
MKCHLILGIASILGACSDIVLQEKQSIVFERLFVGIVNSKESIVLAPSESKSDRVLIGFLALGPIGAIATANTEGEFSRPSASRYKITLEANKDREVVSYSSVDVGDCVEVISTTSLEVLRVIVDPHGCPEKGALFSDNDL